MTSAGAPFLPKLAQAAEASIAFSVGLMVLLMVVTIARMPLVLPFLLQGVPVNPWEIAQSLAIMMRIPLVTRLFIRVRNESIAGTLQPLTSQRSTFVIVLLLGSRYASVKPARSRNSFRGHIILGEEMENG